MKIKILFILFTFSNLLFAGDMLTINDPLYNKQWALKNNGQVIFKLISDLEREKIEGVIGNDIHWVDTSAVPTSKNELIVAVLDSGLDVDHPDLKGRIWFNDKLCTNAPSSKNLACNGFNFLDNNTDITDDVGHGTHVAGIIAANRNNIGIAGAADPRIKIMPIKILNSQVSGFVYNGKLMTDIFADAMMFAINNGAEVINLSLGWPKLIDTARIHEAFQLAEDKNIIIIAAAGNNSKDLPTFPCSYENVVCVGASNNRGELTDFSNYGSKVDLVAPGEYIISTIPQKLESRLLRIANYEVKKGSSQAAPFVTAAVATLKLLYPGLSNDKVRSLLFQSAGTLTKTANNRFVKFGALDMENLLNMAKNFKEAAFVNPQIKAITEVKYRIEDKRFNFKLGLKNITDSDFYGNICVNSNSKSITLDQNCFEVKDLKAHMISNLDINGILNDLSSDSHINFTIRVNNKLYQTSLAFSRDLNNDTELETSNIIGGNFDDMGYISGGRSLSKMTRVIDKFHRIDFPEYFYLEKSKQTATATIVSFLTMESGKYRVKYITLPLINRVLSIHRQDINLDGITDIFIYALAAKKDELLFFNLNNNLNPLFNKNSNWSMMLTTFEGLPIEGGTEKFEWYKLNHPQLGAIVVPSIFKSYSMPEIDNSKNILERIVSSSNHHYYLNPKIDSKTDTANIELRVVDSVATMNKMRADFHLYSDQNIILIKPFPQTNEESQRGEIHTLASLNNGNKVSFVEFIFTNTSIRTKFLSNAFGIEGALINPIINTINGKISHESVLVSLLNRAGAEFLMKKDTDISSPLILRQDWENPIIGLIGAFDVAGDKNYLVENRSTVSFLSNNQKANLPIYRDSIFPGQNFSETLIPILSAGRPGVFINSTLIYGERLYSMIATADGFIRPLRLSVGVPRGCIPLLPETLVDKSSFNYVFLCTDSSKNASLKFLPMLAN